MQKATNMTTYPQKEKNIEDWNDSRPQKFVLVQWSRVSIVHISLQKSTPDVKAKPKHTTIGQTKRNNIRFCLNYRCLNRRQSKGTGPAHSPRSRMPAIAASKCHQPTPRYYSAYPTARIYIEETHQPKESRRGKIMRQET